MMNFTGLVDAELAKARSAHGDIQSIHEGLAVIMEEFEEFKAEVFRRDVNEANLKKELVQVATMCRRFYEDLFSNK